jgi:peptidyl-tRNA hydrolase, PTH1 family
VKLIVGLGNPGLLYAHSRHNLGFSVVKALARQAKIVLKKDRFACALSGRGRIEGQAVILAMPLKFMNLSGPVVEALLRKYGIGVDEMLVVLDDLDLETGKIKIKENGSSGGHKGLASIIESLGICDFARLRIGIDRPKGKQPVSDYVLSGFKREEKQPLKEAMATACDCCGVWASQGVGEAMNTFNKKERVKR